MNKFYLNCPIGLEKLLATELQYKWVHYYGEKHPMEVLSIDKGGVEIQCEMLQGLNLNRFLKIPTRILLRIKSQKCRDLPKLYNIIKKIEWKSYLRQYNVNFMVSCSKSRLMHTGKIANTAQDAIDFYFKANKIPEKKLLSTAPPQNIYLRLQEDLLEISLDTSGELLHKRSSGFRGKAGIRENYAAALLLALLSFKSYASYTLIDPMCGSGTILKEARDFFKLNHRVFAYQNWTQDLDLQLTDLDNLWNFQAIKGYEIDPEVIELADYGADIEVSTGNFFKLAYQEDAIYLFNPPYGKRVKIKGDRKDYFEGIFKYLTQNLRAIKFGVIVPAEVPHIKINSERLSFNQNGIKVHFLHK